LLRWHGPLPLLKNLTNDNLYGWQMRTLTPGMPVTPVIYRLPDGINGGQFVAVTRQQFLRHLSCGSPHFRQR
jgi:hypothetical protein